MKKPHLIEALCLVYVLVFSYDIVKSNFIEPASSTAEKMKYAMVLAVSSDIQQILSGTKNQEENSQLQPLVGIEKIVSNYLDPTSPQNIAIHEHQIRSLVKDGIALCITILCIVGLLRRKSVQTNET